ncbi:hypothetical protein Asppvi_000959 [Aspergillus pseudoviridinutans]|uniref:Amino acid permease/ SLC12A domain-containing protein n=1 Tax=Aspergillus pseudoviridinutans TaxID=1517512 RepID=A0A9P3EP91_9EURO|nr:uncharacterized protein Asppvi_000959 [Aspergillus pseudoviridinutans]GIJ82451.1 hypothetical protein Asppvi_000959 [Aspergillus pseudoviridinutans]
MSRPNPDTNAHQTSLPTAISNDRSHSTDDVNLATANLTKRNGRPTTYSEKTTVIEDSGESIGGASSKPTYDHTHRKLKPRHIQLIGIGGTIGTALYVQVGKSLMKGGPGSLFLAFSIWCFVILAITVCTQPQSPSPKLLSPAMPPATWAPDAALLIRTIECPEATISRFPSCCPCDSLAILHYETLAM